jgi:hypothetical protein
MQAIASAMDIGAVGIVALASVSAILVMAVGVCGKWDWPATAAMAATTCLAVALAAFSADGMIGHPYSGPMPERAEIRSIIVEGDRVYAWADAIGPDGKLSSSRPRAYRLAPEPGLAARARTARDMLLRGQRVVGQRAESGGYEFRAQPGPTPERRPPQRGRTSPAPRKAPEGRDP